MPRRRYGVARTSYRVARAAMAGSVRPPSLRVVRRTRDPPRPMRRRFSSGSALAAVLTALVGALVALVVWIALSAPLAFGLVHPRPVPPPDEAPPRRAASDVATPRLTAAVLLSQAGTEVTDFLAPYAILAASGAFTVHAVAPERAPAPVNGGMAILPELTFEELDARHPGGVDVVILPNVLDPGSPRLRDWVRRQAARGALVASICEGARLLAGTGLLDGRDATSHFAALASLRAAHPSVRWHGDRRWVEDGAFVTSAGVTAAIDAALHVVARVAGDDAAARASRELRLARASEATWAGTQLAGSDVATGVLNGAFAWPRRTVAVPLENGVDELALAAVLDAYPRTFAARSTTVTSAPRPVRSRHGLALVAESTPATIPATRRSCSRPRSARASPRSTACCARSHASTAAPPPCWSHASSSTRSRRCGSMRRGRPRRGSARSRGSRSSADVVRAQGCRCARSGGVASSAHARRSSSRA